MVMWIIITTIIIIIEINLLNVLKILHASDRHPWWHQGVFRVQGIWLHSRGQFFQSQREPLRIKILISTLYCILFIYYLLFYLKCSSFVSFEEIYLWTSQELNGKASSGSVQVTIAELWVSFLYRQ